MALVNMMMCQGRKNLISPQVVMGKYFHIIHPVKYIYYIDTIVTLMAKKMFRKREFPIQVINLHIDY